MKFITDNRELWRVNPICRVLQFAPATYYASSGRPPSAREIRDQELKPQIRRSWWSGTLWRLPPTRSGWPT